MAVTETPQTAIDERELANTDLEQALEERQNLKEQAGAVRKKYREADEHAKAMLAEFALEDGEIARWGRFRIAKRAIPGRSVQFDTEPTSRLTISTLDGGED